MIADDADSIREAMRKLAQAKIQGQAEADKRAASKDTANSLPARKLMFDEPGAPFRGFFLEQCEVSFDPAARTATVAVSQDNVIDPNSLRAAADKMRSLGAEMINSTRIKPVQSFDPNRYIASCDEWDNVTLDSGVTGKRLS